MRHSVGLSNSATVASLPDLTRRCRQELKANSPASACDELFELAASGEPAIAGPASKALFGDLVEPLADSFEPAYSAVYRRFFVRLLESVRRRPGFEDLDEALAAVGVASADDLLRRSAAPAPNRARLSDVERVLVPSRVTLGADIAVVSVVLAGLRQQFPNAEIVFVGGPKNNDLFTGAERIRTVAAPYPRGGTLVERLAVWPALLRIAAVERAMGASDRLLVVDPDSRMTQLGVLPLGGADELRLCFDSRAFGGESDRPLAQLAADWLDAALGPTAQRPLPWTTFQPSARPAESRPLAAVSFGLGGNPTKRVSAEFEAHTIEALQDRGYCVALDCGLGEEEFARVAPLAERVQAVGGVVHQGSFRGFGEFVTAADLFVGYDSSFGHLAAAMGTRGITIFAGAVSERMRRRWSPSGSGASTVLDVAPGESPGSVLNRLEQALP